MYSKEQHEFALSMYHRIGSVTKVIRILGYPCREMLHKWIREEGKTKQPRKRHTVLNTKGHPRNPPIEIKMEALHRCFELGESVKSVSEDIGYSRASIYIWRKRYVREGATSLMNHKNIEPGDLKDPPDPKSELEIEELKHQIEDLKLEVDVLKETLNIIKKDPGADWKALKNREKAVVIDAMRNRYPLLKLLSALHISKSSYYYQIKAIKRGDKYRDLRCVIKCIFEDTKCRYGYRRIHAALKKTGIKISEKVIRRIMNEDELKVVHKKNKKYSSYKGEITPAAPNIVKRNFHSNTPGKLLLSDISEFAIPAGKIYLSPMLDCFDGDVINWEIGTSPNADLVNNMLDTTISILGDDAKPIIHTDRGCHYRWPGWIERMDKHGYVRSMSQKGCSPDNSACEGLFGRIKNEFFYGRDWSKTSIKEFIKLLDEYLHWYNEKRIKKSLGYMSPVEYRRSLGIVV